MRPLLSLILWIICCTHHLVAFKLTVIHNNDFHARYLPIKTSNYAECEFTPRSDECVGGVARTVALMKDYRSKIENLLFLNAGDHFQGTFWYTIGKSRVVAEFVSLMKHDVMALGNHEFDDGPDELRKFIDIVNNEKKANLSVLSCNLEINQTSPLFGLVHKSIVTKINGTKVAIIGYTTPETSFLAKPGRLLKFRDEIEAVGEEIEHLKKEHSDLAIFIGLGHSGYERDLEIASALPDLDLIVGGHTNTFLYSGDNPPSVEKPEGPFPKVIKHSSGEQTLVVQAFAYGKYLGQLDLTFDENGKVVQYEGEPILIDATYPEDEYTREIVEKLNSELSVKVNQTIGYSAVPLDAESCRMTECNLGNLIADSFVNRFNYSASGPCDLISLVNGGNIRTSIDQGAISYRSVISTLPFANDMGLLTITGNDLISVFEHSAQQFRRGGFMQVAGLRVTYNKKSEQQITLASLEAHCSGTWKSVEAGLTYMAVLNDFLIFGGDNYTFHTNNWTNYQVHDSDTFAEYITEIGNVTATIEGRLIINVSIGTRPMIFLLLGAFLLAIFHHT